MVPVDRRPHYGMAQRSEAEQVELAERQVRRDLRAITAESMELMTAGHGLREAVAVALARHGYGTGGNP